MNWFADLKLTAKLLFAGAAVVAVVAAMSWLSVGPVGQIAAAAAFAVVLAVVGGSRDKAETLAAELDSLRKELLAQTEARKTESTNAARLKSSLDELAARASVVDSNHQLVNTRESAELLTIIKGALQGNLVERVAVPGKTGFLATLAGSINELLDSMAATIRQIQGVSFEVNRGAEEISAGQFEHLSQRTEEQSSSLEETASSMKEMTTTVKQNAANAGQANQLALAARGQAESGGAVVGKAISAMSEINSSSKRIADIIGVIDEIAFQTNLLALNAAVEAARAG